MLVASFPTRLVPLRLTSYTGGVHTDGSQHPLGTAADFGIRGSERAAALELARRWNAIGFTAIVESDHVHLQLFARNQNTLLF